MYEQPDKAKKIDTKGIEVVRRDSCQVVKEASIAILEEIMYKKDAEAALTAARTFVADVLSGKLDMQKFVLSKTLNDEYKHPDALPHVQVARKLERRRGYPPAVGTRVPYVIVEDLDNPCGLLAERAEDPEYVAQHGLRLDYLFYAEKQVLSASERLLELLVDDPKTAILDHESVKPLADGLRRVRDNAVKSFKRHQKNVANRQREITDFLR